MEQRRKSREQEPGRQAPFEAGLFPSLRRFEIVLKTVTGRLLSAWEAPSAGGPIDPTGTGGCCSLEKRAAQVTGTGGWLRKLTVARENLGQH